MASKASNNIFIRAKQLELRKICYDKLKRPSRTNIRIWTYPIYIFAGLLMGFSMPISGLLIKFMAGISFITSGALFFEYIKLRRRFDTAVTLLLVIEEEHINSDVDKLSHESG